MRLSKYRNGVVTLPVLLALAAIVLGVTSVFIVKQDDQVVEEVTESLVETGLGLPKGSVDFTPNSKEK